VPRDTDDKKNQAKTVEITVTGKIALERLCGTRWVRKDFLGRLVEWFDRLDQTEQALILGQVNSEDEAAVAALVLKRQKKSAAASVDEALEGEKLPRQSRAQKNGGRSA